MTEVKLHQDTQLLNVLFDRILTHSKVQGQVPAYLHKLMKNKATISKDMMIIYTYNIGTKRRNKTHVVRNTARVVN